MRLLVTGATGFLGSRVTTLLVERGHEVVAVASPRGTERTGARALGSVKRLDAGDPAIGDLVAGCAAVLHFAGVPDPARARSDPATAVRENAGTTANLLERCHEHGAALIYPSTVRAALDVPPDPYALSKRLGEEACRLHRAPAAIARLTSVFGPGQVLREGATGAIANFAARALAGEPIVILGDPERSRDFVYVDDIVAPLESIAREGRWNETYTLASGVSTSLWRAAELVREAARSDSPIETPGGNLAPGENLSYEPGAEGAPLDFSTRPIEEGIQLYVDWLGGHPASEGSPRG